MVRFAASFLIASLVVILTGPHIAQACSAPGSGTAAAAAPTIEQSEKILRAFDVIAEGRIEATDDLVARDSLCQQTRAAIPPECRGDFGLAVCAESLRKIDRFCEPRNAAEISIAKTWKGPALSRVDLHYMPINNMPCGGGVDLKAGEPITVCANYDETGALSGFPCPAVMAEVFERFRNELATLQAASDAAPDAIDPLKALAAYQEEWLDITGALTSYARLAELQPDAAAGPAGIGRVLYAHGDIEAALPHLRRALKLDPGDTLAAELIEAGEMALAAP